MMNVSEMLRMHCLTRTGDPENINRRTKVRHHSKLEVTKTLKKKNEKTKAERRTSWEEKPNGFKRAKHKKVKRIQKTETSGAGSCAIGQSTVIFKGPLEHGDHINVSSTKKTTDTSSAVHQQSTLQPSYIPGPEQYVALDCEFVGVGWQKKSALARCSIVDYDGHVILDLYVKPDEQITDYRTPWSGIRPRDMMKAIPFKNARNMIVKALKNKIVVGHAIHNDFLVLKYFHPPPFVRDTSSYKPLREMANFNGEQRISLKRLTQRLCGYTIQKGEHCSVEDSRAAMSIFKLVRIEWEKSLFKNNNTEKERNQTPHSVRSVSESSDESFFSDKLWPNDL